MKTLVAFGCGYVASALAKRLAAKGIATIGTTRSKGARQKLASENIRAVVWPGADFAPPTNAAWLISVPPDDAGCPVWRAFGAQARDASWIGYLSTTGVYGDLGGRWAFEETPRDPLSREAINRAKAEDEWLSAGANVFRLPGIYGPGRSQLERVREPGARRIVKPGQLFSRAHRDDIAAALELSMSSGKRGRIYNICDDEPAPADAVLAYAAELLGIEPPPAVAFEDANLSPAAQRFYAECKRVSNARAKAELGWRPVYPSYREGLASCLQHAGGDGEKHGMKPKGQQARRKRGAFDLPARYPESEPLADIVESLKKRSRALKYNGGHISCDCSIERADDQSFEKLEISYRHRPVRSVVVRLFVWSDRWAWIDAREPTKNGWKWSWTAEGRLSGPDLGKRVADTFEASVAAGLGSDFWSPPDSLQALWKPILAQGPRAHQASS